MTATDLVLVVTQMLRKKGVVGKFVEFYGAGLDAMSLPDRATIANMAPEYGATMGFFPVDQETLDYMKRTGRTAEEVDLVDRYYKEQGLFRTSTSPDPHYSSTLSLDLATVEAAMAGPKRPQDHVFLKDMKSQWRKDLSGAFGKSSPSAPIPVKLNGDSAELDRRRRGDCGHHELHQHKQSVGHDRRRSSGTQRRAKRTAPEAVGKDEPRAGQPRRHRLPQESASSTSRSMSWGSTSSATAARRASGTAVRCRSPFPKP